MVVRTQTATSARPRAWLLAVAASALGLALAGAARTDAAPPAARSPLAPQLTRALAVPHVDHGRSAAVAVDLRTGDVLFSRHPRLSLAPASTEKLTLSYALLSTLGPAYRIRTEVLGGGAAVGATWKGSLALKGYGDPTLSSSDLRALAGRVRALGIRRVTGGIVADESYFDTRRTAPGWKGAYYRRESAPLSALTVDGGDVGGVVSTDPALAAARRFRDELRARGIAVQRPVRRGVGTGSVLAATASPPLGRVLRRVNGESENFVAETLLKHLGAVETGSGTTAAGLRVVRGALAEAGVPLGGVRLADGSGLSRLDRLTAEALVALLEVAWRDPAKRAVLLDTLAVAGVRGTLERRLLRAPAAGRVFAKTGTTSAASALSGYVGGRYAFAVLHNGSPVSTWWARAAQDRFVTVLAGS